MGRAGAPDAARVDGSGGGAVGDQVTSLLDLVGHVPPRSPRKAITHTKRMETCRDRPKFAPTP